MNELIPIFPLQVVVYPGDELNLHIFEPRYQELINDSAKTKAPFGIPTVLDQKIGGWGTSVPGAGQRLKRSECCPGTLKNNGG